MRVISQNGCYDIPYEQAILLADDGEIRAFTCDAKKGRIASYSTQEKAIKAVEMCREKYGWCKANEVLLTGSGSRFGCHAVDFEKLARDSVFRFPQDNKVEA